MINNIDINHKEETLVGIVQNSRVQVRTGLQQNLPLLCQGEIGFAVDTQRLFIGNGNVNSGAPFAGNTEIITVASIPNNPSYLPVSGGFQQSPNGNLTTFTTTGNVAILPATAIVWNNYPLIPGIGFTISGINVTFATAPTANANLFWQGFTPA